MKTYNEIEPRDIKNMYKALLVNTKGEIQDYRICNTYEAAVRQCNEWQLQHEYDFFDTEIEKINDTSKKN